MDTNVEKARLSLREVAQMRQNVVFEENIDEAKARLKALFERLEDHNSFKVGDVVGWKDGLKNRTQIPYGKPMVVVAIDPHHVNPETDVYAHGYRERLDLGVGIIDGDDEFMIVWIDSERVALHAGLTDGQKAQLEKQNALLAQPDPNAALRAELLAGLMGTGADGEETDRPEGTRLDPVFTGLDLG